MTRALLKNNKLAFRNGVLQIIPAGKDADDCICCGEQIPDCNFCDGEGEGGPFRSLDFEQTISGFPSIQHDVYAENTQCGGFGSNRRHVFKCSGLDVINGTYNYSSNSDCNASLVLDLEATIVYERWLFTIFDTGPLCGPRGTLEETFTYNEVTVSLFPDSMVVAPKPATAPVGYTCYPTWRITAGLVTGTLCTGFSGSNTQTLFPGGSFAFPLCTGFSNFTYSFATTVNGVP
jgi:hypothetical protein